MHPTEHSVVVNGHGGLLMGGSISVNGQELTNVTKLVLTLSTDGRAELNLTLDLRVSDLDFAIDGVDITEVIGLR